MSNFTFSCPACGQNLELDDQYVGELVDCPNCSQTIEVPHPRMPVPPPNHRTFDWATILTVAAVAIIGLSALFLLLQILRRVSPDDILLAVGGLAGALAAMVVAAAIVVCMIMWTIFPIFVYRYLKRIDSQLSVLNVTAARVNSKIKPGEQSTGGA